MVKIKGYEFKKVNIRDSYNRRALSFKNKIVSYLKVFDLIDENIDVRLEKVANKKAQAWVSFYLWDHHMFYSYVGCDKFVDNLGMVAAVIEHFITLVIEEEITQDEFTELFREDENILDQRKEARRILGVDEESNDFEEMHRNYKQLSKKHHPDMPGGSTDKFKEINVAHKTLKKELC